MIGFKAIPLVNNKKESHKQNKKMIQVSNSKKHMLMLVMTKLWFIKNSSKPQINQQNPNTSNLFVKTTSQLSSFL
jgi:hypothetical protein